MKHRFVLDIFRGNSILSTAHKWLELVRPTQNQQNTSAVNEGEQISDGLRLLLVDRFLFARFSSVKHTSNRRCFCYQRCHFTGLAKTRFRATAWQFKRNVNLRNRRFTNIYGFLLVAAVVAPATTGVQCVRVAVAIFSARAITCCCENGKQSAGNENV